MRNLYLHVYHKFGKECVTLFQECEGLVKKLADCGNHRKFTIRCIQVGITPISLKLKLTSELQKL